MMYFSAFLLVFFFFLLVVIWSSIEFYLDFRKKKSVKP